MLFNFSDLIAHAREHALMDLLVREVLCSYYVALV
jgi:hypothetical protein